MNPFIKYRRRLNSYRDAQAAGWDDAEFVSLVERLDSHVAGVGFTGGSPTGFKMTPMGEQSKLAESLGVKPPLYVKDETANVAGSHKARHLFGTMLQYAVDGRAESGELAIASCGNAALAASVVARAEERPIRVFIPTWADATVVGQLEELGARIEVSERRQGESGDPAFLRFQEAVTDGAVPFSVQGPSTPSALDGGRTLGWELADQLADADVGGRVRLFLQVGGGALAASTFRAVRSAAKQINWVLHPVQGEACSPLRRAWELLIEEVAPELVGRNDIKVSHALGRTLRKQIDDLAHADPGRFMYPWEPVGHSTATGILDDVTYDWLPLLHQILDAEGWPVSVTEEAIVAAHAAAQSHTAINAEPTGTAGLAGLWDEDVRREIPSDNALVVVFTGVTR